MVWRLRCVNLPCINFAEIFVFLLSTMVWRLRCVNLPCINFAATRYQVNYFLENGAFFRVAILFILFVGQKLVITISFLVETTQRVLREGVVIESGVRQVGIIKVFESEQVD